MTDKLQSALHREADRYEPRLRRAFFKSVGRMRENVDLAKLAEALERGNIDAAVKATGVDEVPKTLDPLGGITRDAFVKGGRAAAKVL